MIKRLTPDKTGQRPVDKPTEKGWGEREARFRKALQRVNERHGETLKRLAE